MMNKALGLKLLKFLGWEVHEIDGEDEDDDTLLEYCSDDGGAALEVDSDDE